MNTNIIQAVRVGIIVGIAFFAFASEAFAAPMLTPVTVTRVTETSATIIGHVSNPQKNSTVWFELFTNGGETTAVAVQGIWNEGTFEWNLRDLNQGQTYSYRSAAMEGGVTVYSPTSSFTTLSPKPVSATFVYQSSGAVKTTQTQATTQASTQKTEVAKPTPAPVAKKVVAETPVAPTEGFTNGNAAAVIGAGDGLLPSTLIGWLLLLISVLVAVLIAHMIYVSGEKRKKKHEEKEIKEGEEDTE